jgi:regulatory protein SWI6
LTEIESEFTEEMKAKQSTIDSIHASLRDSSAALGKSRNHLEEIHERARHRQDLKLKLANLTRAVEEERSRLAQMQQQYGQLNGEDELQLGDADKGLAIPTGAFPANILSNINPTAHQPQVLDQAQRQLLASLPPTHVLRARVNAYKGNNETLEEGLQGLKSKSSELAAKYRKIIGLCTQVEEDRVDTHLESLLRAVESESDDVELSRVREFLNRVDGGD